MPDESTNASQDRTERQLSEVEKLFASAQAGSTGVMESTFRSDHLASIEIAFSYTKSLDKWHDAIKGSREAEIFALAKSEYGFAVFAVTRGDYRSAYSRLRLFLELVCVVVRGSLERVHLEEWLIGDADTEWAAMLDDKSGILTKRCCELFANELKDEAHHIRGMARTLYRECSTFVHGNLHNAANKPADISFVEAILKDWLLRCDTARLISTFAMTMRYFAELKRESQETLDPMIQQATGKSSAMKNFLDRVLGR